MDRSGRMGAAALALVVVLAGCSGGAATPAPARSPEAASPSAASATPATSASPAGASPAGASPAGETSTCQAAGPGGVAYSIAPCDIAAPSLAGNMLGDPTAIHVDIITPLDYATSGSRYPVVYVLAGFTDPGTDIAYSLAAAPAPAAGKTSPILVVVNGVNRLGGGFYVNSSVTGNWEDAITRDLVGYVDDNYRTLASAASRGIAGHSMGGSGALSIAMHHPDLFSAVFAESPGLFDKDGATDRLGDQAVIDDVLALDAQVAGLTPQAAVAQIKTAALGGEDIQFELAYGAAFVPDPKSPTLMQFPFRTENGKTVRDDAVWARWEAGFGNLPAKIDQYKSNLAQYKGIAIDWGTHDEYPWIPKGCEYTVGLLKAAGLDATGSTFDGGHMDKLDDRMVNHMLPFMEGLLATS
jgi:S-formylglutathione hydrolase